MPDDIHKKIEEWIPGEWDDLRDLLHIIVEICRTPVNRKITQETKTSEPENEGT